MTKISVVIIVSIALLLSTGLTNLRAAAYPDAYPTVETPTLMASLSPPTIMLDDEVTWLIWTDPNCSGCTVHLRIFDMTNWTTVHEENASLGTLNSCGSLKRIVSTVGYEEHLYRFTASMAIDNIIINCSRYLDFKAALFEIGAWIDPYWAVPGDTLKLEIYEFTYPYVDASADVVVYNFTHPSLWTSTGIAIPSANGSQSLDITTNGWSAGNYFVNVTATSVLGTAYSTGSFMLQDLIVNVEELAYHVGEMVNVSIRTYPTASQAGLLISAGFFPPNVVVDEYVTLTDGQASKLYNSSSWTPDFYSVTCNATINMVPVYGFASFNLEPFGVNVLCDKFEYESGETFNINISTTPPQANALFNLTISNSTGATIWTHGPANLDQNGQASIEFNTTGLPHDVYEAEAFVDNTQYVQYGYTYFEVAMAPFNIFAEVEEDNFGYTMPRLNITVSPPQENSSLTIEVSSMEVFYIFSRIKLDISTYTYFLPVVGMPNGSYWVDIQVTSAMGTNSTWCFLSYSSNLDTDGDGLSDSEEQTIGTFTEDPDSDDDGFFEGMEAYHGTNPLDPLSVIPEQILIQLLVILCTLPIIHYTVTKKNKPQKH